MNTLLNIFQIINKKVLFIEKVVLCLLLFSMIFLSFGQVIARNVFSTGFVQATTLVRIEVLWITMIGAALASEYRQHIKIDFLYNIVSSPSSKRWVEIIAQLFAALTCAFLCLASYNYIALMQSDTTATLIHRIPDWKFKLILPYSFFMMCVRFLTGMCYTMLHNDFKNPACDAQPQPQNT